MRAGGALLAIGLAGLSATACLVLGDPEKSDAKSDAGSSGGSGGGWPTGGGSGVDSGPPVVLVQRGSADMSWTATSSATLTPVDLGHAVLTFTERFEDDNASAALVRGTLAEDGVSFTRAWGSKIVGIEWQVIEYSGWSVQRGTVALTSTEQKVPLAKAVDLTRAFALVSLSHAGGTWSNGDHVAVDLTGAQTLRLRTSNAQDAADVAWQVVELEDGSEVRAGSKTLVPGAGNESAPLAAPVDLDRSFVVHTFTVAGTGPAGNTTAVRARLADASTLALTRLPTVTTADVAWFVVQMAGAAAEQHDFTLGSGQTALDVDVRPGLDPGRSFLIGSWMASAYVTQGSFWGITADNAMWSAQLAVPGKTDKLEVRRADSDVGLDATAWVVSF